MAAYPHSNNEFLKQAIEQIEAHLSDENFGVSELAEKVNMSRSNLLRKVKKLTGDSVSVFIRKVRLHHAKDLLHNEELTISEIAFQVGFSSASYFTKCFRVEYGYPPGEEKDHHKNADSVSVEEMETPPWRNNQLLLIAVVILILVASAMGVALLQKNKQAKSPKEKSIAVLPFKNDSNDTSNVYIINGLMDAILEKLQKVEELKVTSRTSVERFRGLDKSIAELKEELEVNYFIEGSGQKIKDEIVLTIRLIEADSDKDIWSKRYNRKANRIFDLQTEVAINVAEEIEVVITPEELKQIEKEPTQNLIAYDYYLQGLNYTSQQKLEGLEKAMVLFKKAIAEDNQFAQPYAYIAVCYYYLEVFKKEKEFTNELNTYADRAMLLNPQLPESLIAKALFYMNDGQYELAVEFFEKVLEYNPDSGWAYNFLSDIYTTYLPDTEKYLIHAAKGIDLVVRGQDSTTAAVSYLHLSNALAQNGFIAEAEKYVNISLGYMPNNVYAETVQTYVELAKNMDLQKAKNALHNTYQKDTTNLLVLQEIAKIYYFMQDYELGWKYYEQLFNKTKNLGWDIYASEKINAAYALEQLKQPDLAKKYLQDYLNFAQADPSIYQPLLLSTYYAYVDDIDQAIVELEAFSEADKYMYWLILFLDQDPVFMKMADHPQFDPLIKKINDKFWKNHEQLKIQLKEETVI